MKHVDLLSTHSFKDKTTDQLEIATFNAGSVSAEDNSQRAEMTGDPGQSTCVSKPWAVFAQDLPQRLPSSNDGG